MSTRFTYGMQPTEAIRQLNGLDDDVAVARAAGTATAAAAATSSSLAAGSAEAARAARDAAIAAWQASTSPAEQLPAISRQLHSGAIVDVFLYDTSRDSDGGAWRKRCKHTSWENEALMLGKWLGQFALTTDAIAAGGVIGDYFQATGGGSVFYQITGTAPASVVPVYRGNTREFPAVALIVVEATRVVIYDATQPTLPMWMVYTAAHYTTTVNGNLHTSVTAINGDMLVGVAGGTNFIGVLRFSFPADRSYGYRIAAYNTDQRAATKAHPLTADWYGGVALGGIANATVNDIAATVLPDAPIDPATGLPVPTVAVATESGISEIQNTGAVLNYATGFRWSQIAYVDQNYLFGRQGTAGSSVVYSTFARIQRVTGTVQQYNAPLANPLVNAIARNSGCTTGKGFVFNAADTGLSILKDIQNAPVKSMVAHITNAYNSGWQVGDSRGAWLADTVAEVVSGAEMITNGAFAADLSGWATQITGGTSTVTWVGGAAQVSADGTNSAYLTQGFATTIGKSYTVTFTTGGGQSLFLVGSSATNGSVISTGLLNAGTYTYTFVAATGWTYIGWTRTAAVTFTIDNVSVKLAEADRSIKAKGVTVAGSLTKAAVAAGAQLVGYSGFSTANYLEQPYNSDLDFGTGDFCVMGWANVTSTTGQYLFSRGSAAAPLLALSISTQWGVICDVNGAATNTGIAATLGLHHIALVRLSGVVQLWIDGVMVWSAANTANVTNAVATLNFGVLYTRTIPFQGSLALWRAGATAPSADQIAQIYRDELPLFQVNAKCTIDGNSTAVTALAFDETADLLHVGTSWGRSAFKGLQRVESTATTVGAITTLGAGTGAHITGGANSARYYQPTLILRDELRRKDDARRAMAREEIPFDYDSTAGQLAFPLPLGFFAKGVLVAGIKKRIGPTKDYTVTYDGYRQIVTFGVSPGATWVQIIANRSN